MNITIVDGWVREAIGIYYQDKSFGPFLQPVRFGVIHGTASPGASAQNIANNWHNTPTDAANAVSAHFIVNKDGTFVQGISLDNSTWGNGNNTSGASYLPAGNPNKYSISMEHCKDDPTYNSDQITPAQRATSFALWDAITRYHKIPRQVVTVGDVSRGGIIRHADIDPKFRTYCPGPYPFADLQNFLNGGPDMFSNELAVEIWESNFRAWGQPIPPRDLGIFTDLWRAGWIAGHFRGAPTTWERPGVFEGKPGVYQNFGSNTAWWVSATQNGWL